MDPLIIGVAGGSGSGKTTIIRRYLESADPEHVRIIQHDSYYRDLSHLDPGERKSRNFDHPSALENELLAKHLRDLSAGNAVEVPLYDYARHVRTGESQTVKPAPVILLDGILLLAMEVLRPLMDLKVYIETPGDLRLMRRIKRDIRERDRTIEGILEQYRETVRPMHLKFVKPSKKHADIVIRGDSDPGDAAETLGTVIRDRIED